MGNMVHVGPSIDNIVNSFFPISLYLSLSLSFSLTEFNYICIILSLLKIQKKKKCPMETNDNFRENQLVLLQDHLSLFPIFFSQANNNLYKTAPKEKGQNPSTKDVYHCVPEGNIRKTEKQKLYCRKLMLLQALSKLLMESKKFSPIGIDD